jgi:HEAT repeat protein
MVRFISTTLCALLLLPSFIRADDQNVAKLIERLIKDEEAKNRRSAAVELAKLGPDAKRAVAPLINALKDMDFGVRDAAEFALRKIGEASVEPLVAALKDKDEFVRLRIVNILGAIGTDAKGALPALEAATRDESEFVSNAAKEAVYRVQLDAKTLQNLLRDKDEEKRQYAVKVLAMLSTEQAKPALIELCKVARTDKSKSIRQEAAKTLGKIGKDTKELTVADRSGIVTTLVGALKDADDAVRLNAVTSLGNMGRDATPALASLQQAYRASKNDEFKLAVEKAVEAIQGRRSSK